MSARAHTVACIRRYTAVVGDSTPTGLSRRGHVCCAREALFRRGMRAVQERPRGAVALAAGVRARKQVQGLGRARFLPHKPGPASAKVTLPAAAPT